MAQLKTFTALTTVENLNAIIKSLEFEVNHEVRNIHLNRLRMKTDIRFLGDTNKVFVSMMIMW